MTDQAAAVSTASDAQLIADANSIDSIIDGATEQATEATKPSPENAEQDAGKDDDTPFPKKAVNAISRRDKQIGKLRAQYEAAQAEINRFREQSVQKPQQPNQTKADSEPKEADYNNYADFMRAVQKYDLHQEIAKLRGEQQESQQSTQKQAQDQAWENQRLDLVDKQSEEFVKDFPDVQQMFNDNAELIKSYSPALKRALLAADNAPLAFYNLAKDDKLQDLADMSLEDAKVEIRVAQLRQAVKPQSKAPTPLPASRGSVASEKSLDSMSGDELLKWVNS